MIDEIKQKLLEGNNKYRWKIIQETEKVNGGTKLKYPILILTCMDPRIDVHRIFQLEPGDAFILRNAGNIFTEDVLRSILIAIYEYDIKYIIILGHLDCGMTKIHLPKLIYKLPKPALKKISQYATNIELSLQMFFKTFIDEIKNINNQIERLTSTKELPSHVKVFGMLYDPHSGVIFDSKELINYPFTESFLRDYKNIIEKKKIELIDYFESIEKEIIGEPIAQSIKDSSISELQQIKKTDLEKMEPIAEQQQNINNAENDFQQNLQGKEDIITNYQIALYSIQKIRIPTIHIPKIKIRIPKVHSIEMKR